MTNNPNNVPDHRRIYLPKKYQKIIPLQVALNMNPNNVHKTIEINIFS